MTNDSPSPTDPGQIIDDFLIMEQIGSGAFSKVHLAEHLPTHCFAAVKIVDLAQLGPADIKSMIREISVFQLVSHRNICSLYRISTVAQSLLFFMEYAPGGTLLHVVNEKKGLSEPEAQFYFIQLFAAVRHLHLYHFVAHRDLKLENVMIGKNKVVKLADFGLAGTSCDTLMHTFLGTPGFQAPEIIAGNEYNEKCVVWSLGVCLWAIVAGRMPFSTENSSIRLFLEEVVNIQYPKTFSPLLLDLLKRMLIVKPDERPHLMQLQDHMWLKGLEQLSPNIAPQPVYFQSARSLSAVSKLKRQKVTPNEKVLKKCEDMGIDIEPLKAELANGETTQATTIYFVLCNPVTDRPAPHTPVQSGPELVLDITPEPEKNSAREQLPPLNAAYPRRGKQEFSFTRPARLGGQPLVPRPAGVPPLIASMRKPLDLGGRKAKT
jgi:serine/threonine protein kinase